MSLSIPPELWQALCSFLATYRNGEATLYQHEGTVRKIALTTVIRSREDGLAEEVTLRKRMRQDSIEGTQGAPFLPE